MLARKIDPYSSREHIFGDVSRMIVRDMRSQVYHDVRKKILGAHLAGLDLTSHQYRFLLEELRIRSAGSHVTTNHDDLRHLGVTPHDGSDKKELAIDKSLGPRPWYGNDLIVRSAAHIHEWNSTVVSLAHPDTPIMAFLKRRLTELEARNAVSPAISLEAPHAEVGKITGVWQVSLQVGELPEQEHGLDVAFPPITQRPEMQVRLASTSPNR